MHDEIQDFGPQASTEEVLAIVTRCTTTRFAPSAAIPGARQDERKPGSPQTERKPLVDKDDDLRFTNCAAKGHATEECRKTFVKFEDRPCWICKTTGHIAAKCPMNRNAKLLETDGGEAMELQVVEFESGER